MPNCIAEGVDRTRTCVATVDRGSNQCAETEDRGHRDCCRWWPCSMFCRAWVWISKVVCVAVVWMANVVCVSWAWIATGVCFVVDVVVTVVNAIITVVEAVVGWVLSALAYLVQLIFLIPGLGRVLREIWNVALAILFGALGVGDTLLGAIGIRPEKKLRVGIIYFTVGGTPVGDVDQLINAMQIGINTFREKSNIRIVPIKPLVFSSGFKDTETASRDWIIFESGSADALDLNCGGKALEEDWSNIGNYFESLAMNRFFFTNWRSLTGYGAPIIVFVIRSMVNASGCSLGPISDYVTLVAEQPLSFKHELGHACNLFHCCATTNMMNGETYPTTENAMTNVEDWQTLLVRASRHVSYF